MTEKAAMKDARADFADLVNRCAYGKERIVLTRRGKGVVAVVPIEDLELLEQIEDRIDLDLAREALKEKGKNVPWSRVKETLGL